MRPFKSIMACGRKSPSSEQSCFCLQLTPTKVRSCRAGRKYLLRAVDSISEPLSSDWQANKPDNTDYCRRRSTIWSACRHATYRTFPRTTQCDTVSYILHRLRVTARLCYAHEADRDVYVPPRPVLSLVMPAAVIRRGRRRPDCRLHSRANVSTILGCA